MEKTSKLAHYDKDSFKLLGWYDEEIHTDIPSPTVEISYEEWQNALHGLCNKVNVEDKTLSLYDFRTEEERMADENRIAVENSKEYLSSTDWIIAKINEVMIEGTEEEILATKEKYAVELQKRKEAREVINELD